MLLLRAFVKHKESVDVTSTEARCKILSEKFEPKIGDELKTFNDGNGIPHFYTYVCHLKIKNITVNLLTNTIFT